MTAIEKMRAGMQLMKEACAEMDMNHCRLCPFYSYCIDQPLDAPEDWDTDKKTT